MEDWGAGGSLFIQTDDSVSMMMLNHDYVMPIFNNIDQLTLRPVKMLHYLRCSFVINDSKKKQD